MQHFGHLEALLQSRFPKHELVFRNLGFSGDELTLRLRSAGFGTPDEHLQAVRGRRHPGVLWLQRVVRRPGRAGEVQAGPGRVHQAHAGAEVQRQSRAAAGARFADRPRGPARSATCPTARRTTSGIALYTQAMAEVAKAQGRAVCRSVCTQLRSSMPAPTAADDQRHSPERPRRSADGASHRPRAVRTTRQAPADLAALEKLRQAVRRQGFHLVRALSHDRRLLDLRRPGRPEIRQRPDQSRSHAARAGSAGRDDGQPRPAHLGHWPSGSDLAVDDSNTPPFIEVITNKPGPLPGGKHVFLGGEEAIGKMTVGQGHEGQPGGSEEDVSRAGQSRANGVRHQGAAVGGRVGKLSALEAQGRNERQAADPGRHRRRRPGRQVHHVCRQAAQSHRLRVLERRRAGRHGARPAVPQGHRRRRSGRHARARDLSGSTRPTRTTPRTALRSTRAERCIFRKARSTIRRSKRPMARRCGWPTPACFATSRGRRSSTSTFPTASPIRTATCSTVGGRTSWSTAPGRIRITRRCSPATSIFRTSIPQPPMVYKPRTRPCPGIEYLSSRHFPPEMQGQPAGGQRDRFSGHPAIQGRRTRARASRPTRWSRFCRRAIRTFGRPISKSVPTARCTSPIGRTRSSATCSTTCAIPAATARTAACIA